jgi:hypothetical protein
MAAVSPKSTYDFTLTDRDGRPVAHARGTPAPRDPARRRTPGKPQQNGNGPPGPAPPALTLIDRGPPGEYGTWQYEHGDRMIIFTFEGLDGDCDHRHQAPGHDPGVHLKHLTAVLHPECTFPTCRTPHHQADYEHSKPWGQGGITCLCSCGPVCRRNHKNKQQPGWKLEATGKPGWFKWTLPSGRTYLSGPDLYPI